MKDGDIIDIITDEGYNKQWIEIVKGLPEISVLKNSLAELMSTDKTAMTSEELKDFFYKNAYLFTNNARPLNPIGINKQSFWRVRCNIQESENTEIQETYSYPKICNLNGRANIKGSPVFYCAFDKTTAIFESKPKVNDIIYLSEWGSLFVNPVNVSFLLSDKISSKSPFYQVALDHLQGMKDMAMRYGIDKGTQLEMISIFISNAFIQETFPYSLTSWLANDMLYNSGKIDMIIYPSIARILHSCNIAINPTVVDAYLRLKKVYKIQVTQSDSKKKSLEVLCVGDFIDNNVVWRELSDNDKHILDQTV